MKTLLKTVLPILTTSTFMLAACNNVVKTSESMNQSGEDYSLVQAELDSAAYRNIFNSTVAAKDSDAVAQFNELASNMKSTFNELDRMITDEGISKKEYCMKDFHLGDLDTSRVYQHFVDTWMYKNFFNKLGILTEDVEKKCDAAAKRTKPY